MPEQIITYSIDPLNILTMGMISGDPLNLITDGFVTATIEEEIIDDIDDGGSGDFSMLDPFYRQDQENKKKDTKKKKKITARVYINGLEYVETVTVDDLTLNVKDVRLEVGKTSLNEIKVKIILPEVK